MTQPFDTGKLHDDLQKLINEAESLLRTTAVESGEKAAEVREQAQDTLRSMKTRLSALEKDLKGHVRIVDTYVQDNPWAAVAVAGGIALLVGVLLGRRG
jgi:ElaB/YqjD/DUF883 family membrane-anchored ribosome-binding protein